MTDHNERACRYCGSLLHHEDVCGPGVAAPLPVDWRKPPKPVLSVDTIEGYEPAPAPPPPLPEVPEQIRQAPGPWAAYLVALDAALRARGGL